MGFEFRVAVNSQKCGTRFKDGSCWNCTCFTIRVEGMVMFARVRVVSALCGGFSEPQSYLNPGLGFTY